MGARVRGGSGLASADVLRFVATDAAGEQAELLGVVLERLRAATPELFSDPAVAREMTAATQANLTRIHMLLCDPDPLAPDVLPAEPLDLARASARRLVPLIAMLEACRLAQVIISDWWRHRLEAAVTDRAELIAAGELLRERINAFIDLAASEVRAAYEQERSEWEGSAAGRRARLVFGMLAGDAVDVDVAAGALGYPLRGPHVGVVLWCDGPRAMSEVADSVRRGPAGLRCVTIDRSDRARWMWVATGESANLDFAAATERGVAVAVGPASAGIDGFRRTHRDALEAQRVAVLQGAGRAPLTRYEDVELAAIMSRDPADLRRFVRRTLGPLAQDDPSAARLRETLAAYLASGESQSGTARRLAMHRNTVGHRLRALEEALGPSLGPRRVELELALELVRTLGTPPAIA
jgi:DNA-binding PucR family transcriptional regulator